MATLSYDGQSFIVDGRRIWLVSGAIHYARVPHQLWRQRIRAAKQAGLNCVETYVFWNLHEPRPGVFHFEGDANLRAFVKMIGEEGLYCILRPGPYICSEWDFGGLPAWLHRVEGIRFREANGPFLEACARYLSAVMAQVADLQITGADATTTVKVRSKPGVVTPPPAAGPIVMVQAENEWFCHNPPQGDGYLRELVRYLRENGCTVPINVCNNLWQRVDGTIDTWNSASHLAEDLRQMYVVQPQAPRIVTEYWPGWFDTWGRPHHAGITPQKNLCNLAQILAVGAQYNLYMFHGGTNFGFWGGRSTVPGAELDSFITTSYDFEAPLREGGGRGEKYNLIKRVSTFASQFGQVFAHLQPQRPHVALAPYSSDHSLSVLHQQGSQGEVVFILRGKSDNHRDAKLLLPDGRDLTVPMGDDCAAWLLLNTNLGGLAELTFTNLRPFAFLERKMLVLFGPAGAAGVVCINGAVFSATVPTGQQPRVESHEDLTVVILNNEQVDAAYPTSKGIIVGAAGLADDHSPLPLPGWATPVLIDLAGKRHPAPAVSNKTPAAPRLAHWQQHTTTQWLTGESTKFEEIPGPASLEALRCDYGYGWYRIQMKRAPAGNLMIPGAGDRLHVYAHGKLVDVVGRGAGASAQPTTIAAGSDWTVLVDNLGRFNYGAHLGDQKGIFSDVYAVSPVKLGKAKVVEETSPDPFTLGGFWPQMRSDNRGPANAYVWKLATPADRRLPLILELRNWPMRAMVLVNDKPLAMVVPGADPSVMHVVIDPGQSLRRGHNELKLALYEKLRGRGIDPAKFIRLYRATGNCTEGARWSFARWAPPAADQFKPASRRAGGQPCWFRCEFAVTSTQVPLWLEPRGLTKGQIYINGHNAGRYFVATAAGKAVPPQTRYYLPEPWLRTDHVNELLLFEEHGKSPAGCRLVYDAGGPYG